MPALLSTLASYVPAIATRGLAVNPAAPTEPSVEDFPAAVLLADLSGFTPLAERLAQQGPAGTEELTHLLNTYFGQLIDLVTSHGGDVATFAGDALLALWPVQTEGPNISTLQQAVLRAAQCSLEVQARLHGCEAAQDVQLSLHIGLGAGLVSAMRIGGVLGRWELLFQGDGVIQACRAGQHAGPGQIILSPEAWQQAQGACQGVTLPAASGNGFQHAPGVRLDAVSAPLLRRAVRPPVLPPQAETALRAYIPGAVISRLALRPGTHDLQQQSEWLAELRRVTVLFVHLPDVKPGASMERVHSIMCLLQTALYRYEGSINKMIANDSGATLVAAFGLPPLAHEDDAVRGVQAALGIQAELRRLRLHYAIGLGTGRVFCGSVGNRIRCEYTMIGDTINIAARLMEHAAATGSDSPYTATLLLCDAETYQSAHKRLVFDALPPVRLKGKAEPVAVYRVLSERATPTTGTQLLRLKNRIVGRQAERMLVVEQLQALLRGGSGGVIVLEGEAGIGKSRLLQELHRHADVLRLKVLSLAGDAFEKTAPYQAWRPLFSQMLDLEVLSEPEARRQHILGVLELGLDQDVQRLAPLLNVVLPLDLPDNDLTAPMTGQMRADRTRALLLQLLQFSVSQSPKVVVIEDAHWLDSASWALTLAAAQQVRPALLVIALRPFAEAPPAEFGQILRLPNLHRIRLKALAQQDTLALVRQQLSVKALPEPVSALILEKAEGNPFFSEELAYALRDSGLISIADGECQLTQSADHLRTLNQRADGTSLLDTVENVVTSRIDRLPPRLQLTLKVASVIGREFAVRILNHIYPLEADRPHLAENLTALEALDLIHLGAVEPEPVYVIKHTLIRDAAYHLMLFAQRRELHRRVGEAIEALFADRLSELRSALASHFFQGEVWDRATEHLVMASDAAVRLNAHAEARAHYAQALECLGHLPYTYRHRRQYVDITLKQAALSWGVEPPDSNLARLSEAETLVKALPGAEEAGADHWRRLIHINYWLGRSHFYRNALREALYCYEAALVNAQWSGDQVHAAIIANAVAEVLLAQRKFSEAAALLLPASSTLATAAQWPEWILAAGNLGVCLAASGRYAEAQAAGAQAVARAQEINDGYGAAAGHVCLGFIHLFGGNAGLALEEGRAACEAAEQCGSRLYAYWGCGIRGWAEGRLGNQPAAAEAFGLTAKMRHSLGSQLAFDDWFAAAEAEVAVQGAATPALALRASAVPVSR